MKAALRQSSKHTGLACTQPNCGIAPAACDGQSGAMVKRSPLDDPESAAFAWARYRRLMRFMFLLTVGVVIIAMAVIYKQNGPVSPHFFIATALGIGFSMLLMSALMGLVFLSSGTGHDESIDNSLDSLGQDDDGADDDRAGSNWRG